MIWYWSLFVFVVCIFFATVIGPALLHLIDAWFVRNEEERDDPDFPQY